MTRIELTSKMGVTLVDSMGTDETVVRAARVSIVGAGAETEHGERKGLLKFLMTNKHASPFEHCTATFMIECPLFVRSEWHRHRTQSFNEVSGRYSVLQPRFYVPDEDRPMTQVGKPGSYRFELGSKEDLELVRHELGTVYDYAQSAYSRMLDAGIAKEVARDCLPLGLYTAFYATANLRNWLNFLTLRTSGDALYEIREAAGQVETQLHRLFPTVLNLWDESGRNAL